MLGIDLGGFTDRAPAATSSLAVARTHGNSMVEFKTLRFKAKQSAKQAKPDGGSR